MDGWTALGVLLMDAGLLTLAVGLASLIKPPRRLGIATRRRAVAVACAGAALSCAAAVLPAPLARPARAPGRAQRIDDFVPAYQFHERHEIRIHAAPRQVFRAIKTVTAEEISLFRTLTWLRSPRLPGRPVRESILAPPPAKPILDVATASGFVPLAEEPDREIVLGTLVILSRHPAPGDPASWQALTEPGNAKAAINFLVEPEPDGGCRLSTETRVFATDPASRRRFAAYWRIILPGSALIRVEWLRAIRHRAEAGST